MKKKLRPKKIISLILNDNNVINRFVIEISALGSFSFIVLILLYSFIFTELYSKLFYSIIISTLLIIIIRILFYKERPNNRKYKNWFEKIDSASFPSGHASRLTILILFCAELQLPFIVLTLNIILAAAILLLRFICREHYLFDIVLGILIGMASYIPL